MSVKEAISEFIRAEKALKASETLLGNGYYEDSISRSYYAVLHAAKMALILEDINVSSHTAVRKLFSKHFMELLPKYHYGMKRIIDDIVAA